MRGSTASRPLPATSSASPTTCAARWMRCRRNCASEADAGMKALLDGVELTERELIKALEKNGVRQFEPQGEKFDPNLHQAMYEVPDPSVPAGSVVQVVQAGYMIGERVLRPALVGGGEGRSEGRAGFSVRQRQQGCVRSETALGRGAAEVTTLYLSSMPSRTAEAASAGVQTSARAMPTMCIKPPEPKRSHCTTMMSVPVPMSLACAMV